MVFNPSIFISAAERNFFWALAITIIVLLLLMIYLAIKAKIQGPVSSIESMIDEHAIVYKEITPEKNGSIYLRGSYWQACSNEKIKANELVKVISVQRTRITVKKLKLRSNK